MQQGESGEISAYELCREKRMRENRERMQKLGIFDLSHKLIKAPKPLGPTRPRGRPRKIREGTPPPPKTTTITITTTLRSGKIRGPPPPKVKPMENLNIPEQIQMQHGGEISEYQVCRENRETMQELAIFDLSQKPTTRGRGRPRKPKTPLPPLPRRPRGRPRKFRDAIPTAPSPPPPVVARRPRGRPRKFRDATPTAPPPPVGA